jgi:sterol desaturase/sphingolipid hydroxylase (fatty acid hydroxylase superfamily)
MSKIFFVTFAILTTVTFLEHLYPAEKNKTQKFWYLQASILITLNYFLIGSGKKLINYFFNKPLFNLETSVRPLTGAIIIFLVLTFTLYWWHRLRHKNKFFWKIFHQLHHSPQRFEAIVAFYRHPLEKLLTSFLGAFLTFYVLGLNQKSLFWAHSIILCIDVFAHMNIQTHPIVGYLIQTPEIHRLHHNSKVLNCNYGHLTIWDRLFGTFMNPNHAEQTYGFGRQNFNGFIKTILFRG